MWRLISLLGPAALVALILPSSVLRAQDFIAVPAFAETIEIAGVAVRIDVGTDYRITAAGAANVVELRVRLGLADLEAKTGAILAALAAHHLNEVGLSFPRLDPPVVADGAIRISGIARIATRDPLFGAPVVETGQFTLALRPEMMPFAIGIRVDLLSFEIGGGLMVTVGVEEILRDFIEEEIRRAFAETPAVFTLPPELLTYGIRIRTVDFVDFGGLPGLVATAQATLDGTQLMTAVIELAVALGP